MHRMGMLLERGREGCRIVGEFGIVLRGVGYV